MTLAQVFFSFDGRIGRQTFWLKGVLLLTVLAIVGGVLAGIIGGLSGSGGLLAVLFIAVYIVVLWMSLAVSIKRWHDRGKSGWWVLIGLIPLIGGIWAFIETGPLAGDPGTNRFGDETH
jgi:uncharacterized membrane protein YhaH (DUF805 family)